MLSYNDMINCEQKYAYEKKQMSIEKYKAFVEYLKKVLNIPFEDNKEQIASYLKETTDQLLFLSWCVENTHYYGFTINRLTDETICISLLKASDVYYDQILNLESNMDNDELVSFFDKEYKYFQELFIPNYQFTYLHNVNKSGIDKTKSLVWKIAEKFNKKCFDEFEIHFKSLGIKDENDFMKSKFSLSFTDEKRSELDKEVFDLYNSYREKVVELTKKFDESVKDLK